MADAADPLVLGPYGVGNTETPTVATNTKNDGVAANPASATFVIWDEDRPINGTATGGSTTTLVDVTLNTFSDDDLNGVTIRLKYADGKERETVITDFVSATGTVTFAAQPVAIAADDTYEILGTPLLGLVAASISTNKGSTTFDDSNVLAYDGDFAGAYQATFASTVHVQPLLVKVRVPKLVRK